MHEKRLAPALVLTIGAILGCERQGGPSVIVEPTNVVVALPTVQQITDYEEFTGHTEAIRSVQLQARVTGYLEKKHFQDGDEVKEGDLLYEIDARPYKASLDYAESTVAQSEAHRKRIEADFRRASNLFERGAIGKEEFDLTSGNFAEADAQVKVALARRDTARLNYSFTRVTAPMSGQLSRTLVDPGNLIRQNNTIMTDIVAADQLYVYFDLNENALSSVRGLINNGRVASIQGKGVPVLVGLSDEETFPYKGLVNFSENKVDAATGTLRIRGIIDNPRPWILSPGLFVRVRLPIGSPHPALLISEDALGSDQGRRFVYVVDAVDEVIYRPVEVGAAYGTLRTIRRGLAEDEKVIVSGLQRVRPGTKVSPKMGEPLPAPIKTAVLLPH